MNKYIYFNHAQKIYTVVDSEFVFLNGELRPYDYIELQFAKENGYCEVDQGTYKQMTP